jgi:predicted ATPase/DNA-binding CsgD family transcriptional regulator/DNA-binding XRE family transcriptional regulator
MPTTDGPWSFAVLLRRYRARAGLSQEELAERAGLSRRGISDLERGERQSPRSTTVRRLADALNLNLTERAAVLASGQSPTPVVDGALPAPPPLPVPLTRFIGRERELADLRRLFASTRLLTLVGGGGIGKTRLALQFAAQLSDEFADGVALVELAGLQDPVLVPYVIAAELGVHEQPDRLVLEMLTEALRGRQLLLVLDNCEHLISACAMLADQLLRACTNLRVLTTSRESLAIGGETAWRVPALSLPMPLARPPLDDVTRSEAAQLFTDRAQAALPSFAITELNSVGIAKICRRLDGIPLALELAAARVPVLSVEQIANRLDDSLRLLVSGSRVAPPRQQTLRATIEWSYRLLEEYEQRLFERLSVFVGAFDLEAAEVVCAGGEVTPDAVLDLLAQLVNKSLIVLESRVGDSSARYRLLEIVRQYAIERLETHCETQAVQARHAGFFANLAHAAGTALRGPKQQIWLERLEREQDNLRGAMTWAKNHGQVAVGLQIAVDICRFWSIRGYLAEGREWLTTLLALSDSESVQTELLSGAESAQGHLAFAQGDWARAERCFETSLALRRESGDLAGIAASLRDLGSVAQGQGAYDRAFGLLAQSLAQWRELADMAGVATCLDDLGEVARHRGDYDRAAELVTESLSLKGELGDSAGMAFSLNELANVARHRGNYARGRAFASEALAVQREIGDLRGAGWSLTNLGIIAQAAGEEEEAAGLYEEALILFGEAGDKRGVSGVLAGLSRIARVRGDLDGAQMLAEQALALSHELGEVRAIALGLGGLGGLALARGDTQRGLTLHRESLVLFARIGDRRGMAMGLDRIAMVAALDGRPQHAAELFGVASELLEEIHAAPDLGAHGARVREATIADLRVCLGAEAFARAWESGRSQSVEKVVAEVLSVHPVRRGTRVRKPSLRHRRYPLTSRERDVVRLVAQGCTNREIGAALVISAGTARVHVEHVLAKLDVRSRAQIAAWAVQHDLT